MHTLRERRVQLEQSALRSLTCGFVPKRQYRPDLLAIRPTKRLSVADGQHFDTVRPDDPPPRLPNRLPTHRARQRQLKRRVRSPILGEEAVGVAVGIGLDIEASDTVDGSRSPVHHRDPAHRIGDDHALGELIKDDGLRRSGSLSLIRGVDREPGERLHVDQRAVSIFARRDHRQAIAIQELQGSNERYACHPIREVKCLSAFSGRHRASC
ncbi:hypothetical protein [Methylobacterium sp. WL6]|uniref:hypothetical protein n=1 Tax=Methylobacterium sp. WL6 TaxID=2603901 RepID=UPI001FEE776F|nr:hypothetical protein [Methylobacterium sp. WL6]